MTQGIYKLVNNKNNKVYVGQSIDIEQRFKDHMNDLKNNNHHAYKLQKFYNQNKHLKSFEINYEILETVDNKKYLDGREYHYIQLYDSHKNGYNSIGLNGDATHTKKREQQSKKAQKIHISKEEYGKLINKYKDNLYLQYTGYNDTYLYRVNEAIKYFVKNYNLDLYKAEISQYKSKVDLFVIDKNFNVVQRYEYKTKHKAMGLNRHTYKYENDKFSQWHYDRYKMFDNIVRSKKRYIWFMERYSNLDEEIIQYDTLKYYKKRCSIPFKVIRESIGYEYGSSKFRTHIIEDKEVQEISKELNISYPNGRAVLDLINNQQI